MPCAWRQSTYRRAHRQTLAEGYREIEAVLRNDVPIQTVFACEELLFGPEGTELAARLRSRAQTDSGRFHTVSRHVYGRLAMRTSVGGLLVEIKPPVHSLRGLVPHPNERLVVLEDVDKPGNIGAVLRTMRAAGSGTLILATHGGGGTDLMNPNVISRQRRLVLRPKVRGGSGGGRCRLAQPTAVHRPGRIPRGTQPVPHSRFAGTGRLRLRQRSDRPVPDLAQCRPRGGRHPHDPRAWIA